MQSDILLLLLQLQRVVNCREWCAFGWHALQVSTTLLGHESVCLFRFPNTPQVSEMHISYRWWRNRAVMRRFLRCAC